MGNTETQRAVSNSGTGLLVTILCCLPNPAQAKELPFIPFQCNAVVSKDQNMSSPSEKVVEFFPNDHAFSLKTKHIKTHRMWKIPIWGVGSRNNIECCIAIFIFSWLCYFYVDLRNPEITVCSDYFNP